MKKNKKLIPLIIALLVVDVAVTVFLLVINIIMLAKVVPAATTGEAANNSQGLIRELIRLYETLNKQSPALSFLVFVGPLLLLLAANIIGLFIYVKKTSANSPAKLQDLSDEQKEALRQELLKDLSGDSKAKDEPEDEAEEESEEEPEEEKPTPKKKAAPKAKAKAEEPKEEKEKEKPTHRNYHVSKRAEDGKWTVKFAGGEKVIKLFDTQKEALEYTKKMAENQGGVVLVHASKGANKGRIKSK